MFKKPQIKFLSTSEVKQHQVRPLAIKFVNPMQTKITSVKFQVTGRGVVVVEDDLDKTGNNDLKSS